MSCRLTVLAAADALDKKGNKAARGQIAAAKARALVTEFWEVMKRARHIEYQTVVALYGGTFGWIQRPALGSLQLHISFFAVFASSAVCTTNGSPRMPVPRPVPILRRFLRPMWCCESWTTPSRCTEVPASQLTRRWPTCMQRCVPFLCSMVACRRTFVGAHIWVLPAQ